MTEYRPVKTSSGVNSHVIHAVIIWLIISVLCVFGALWAVYYFPVLSPKDPDILWRIVLEKIVGQVAGVFFGSGIILFYEIVTNGNLLGRVLQDAKASAIFLVGVLLCSTCIFCFV